MEQSTRNWVAVISIGEVVIEQAIFFWLTIWIKRPSGIISLNRSLVLFIMVAQVIVASDTIARAIISQHYELADATIC